MITLLLENLSLSVLSNFFKNIIFKESLKFKDCALKFPNPKNKKQRRSDLKNFIKFSLSKNKKDFGNMKILADLADLADDYVAIS